jgi:SAM-dependent methyltransferase
VYGLDHNAAALKSAENWETVKRWDLDSQLTLPFDEGYFDAVVARDILEHLQKPWNMVAELRRVTRVGGCVLASVICERGRRTWSDYTHVRGFTQSSAGQMFEDGGFKVVGTWRMGPVPLSSRARMIRFVPYLLWLPPFGWLWTSSYEVKAIRTP